MVRCTSLLAQRSRHDDRFVVSNFFELLGFGIAPATNHPFVAPLMGDQKAMSASKGRGAHVIIIL